jgi:hypothetical protein
MAASQLNELLMMIKEPLGCSTQFHLNELRPKLDRWMRKEGIYPKGAWGSWDPSVVTVGAAELLRFLVVYSFDVDVTPPALQKKKLWGGSAANMNNIVQKQQGLHVGLGLASSSLGGKIAVVQEAPEGGPEQDALQLVPEPEAEADGDSGGEASPTDSLALSPIGSGPSPKGMQGLKSEDSLEWMERAVSEDQPSSSQQPETISEDSATEDNLGNLSELERNLEATEKNAAETAGAAPGAGAAAAAAP